jgi:hypothetical protein
VGPILVCPLCREAIMTKDSSWQMKTIAIDIFNKGFLKAMQEVCLYNKLSALLIPCSPAVRKTIATVE